MNFLLSVKGAIEIAVGWIFSPSWLPPKDFELLRWLFVPGYGYGIILVTLALLELIIPQERRQWSRASFLSGTYLALAGKTTVYILLITPLFRQVWVHLGLPSLHLDKSLPWPVYAVVSLLVVSFFQYWAHRWMHRIPLFWHIHKIHHSIVNLNWASVYQKHVLELVLYEPLHLVGVLALGTDLVAPFGLFCMAVDTFAHSNVRFNIGLSKWLSYAISTPQAHRVHHSIEPRHYDSNFGNSILLWDHLFGTFCYDPAAARFGVSEPVPPSFVKQQLLPFIWIARDGGVVYRRHVGTRLNDLGSPRGAGARRPADQSLGRSR